jgi:hypothetical protein
VYKHDETCVMLVPMCAHTVAAPDLILRRFTDFQLSVGYPTYNCLFCGSFLFIADQGLCLLFVTGGWSSL